jgi:carbohydrate-binding DOMON domain-containing protein
LALEILDPEGDDHGPGTYTYPQDVVFNAGNFDILNFQVGSDDENIIFKFIMRGPVDNEWGSPNGVALQTFDIYIDRDLDSEGGRALLPGRNLSLGESFAWDYAIHVEGWTPGIYEPTSDGDINQIANSSQFQILADPAQRKVTVRVPKALLGTDPENWAYAAMVLSQEGFPSGGVMRVRDVLAVAEQWRVGGAPASASNHTRVIDLVWAEAGVQEEWLSAFEPVNATQTELTAADFAQILMFSAADQ